jgi:hypothetical protein
MGPFRRLAGGRSGCGEPRPFAVDVSGPNAAYAQQVERCADGQAIDSIVVTTGGGRRIVARALSARGGFGWLGSGSLAFSAPYVAWSSTRTDANGRVIAPGPLVLVYDLRKQKIVQRFSAKSLRSNSFGAFDIQRDGTIGVVADDRRSEACDRGIAALKSVSRRPHALGFRPLSSGVRIGAGTLVVALPKPSCTPGRLVAVDFKGNRRTLASVAGSEESGLFEGGFDFDGNRFAFAVSRRAGSRDLFVTRLYLGRLSPK